MKNLLVLSKDTLINDTFKKEKNETYATLPLLFERSKIQNLDKHLEIKSYCLAADNISKANNYHYGFGSLKFAIYQLRGKIPFNKCQEIFDYIIKLIIDKGINVIQRDAYKYTIEKFPETKIIFEKSKKRRLNFKKDLKIVKLESNDFSYQIALNESRENLTALIFKKMPYSDAIVFKDSKLKSGGIVLRGRGKYAWKSEKIDLNDLLQKFPQNEPWLVPYPTILICGGPKHPKNTTDLSINEILDLFASFLGFVRLNCEKCDFSKYLSKLIVFIHYEDELNDPYSCSEVNPDMRCPHCSTILDPNVPCMISGCGDGYIGDEYISLV